MNKTFVYDKDTRTLKSISTLNLIPFILMLTWIMFVIVIYANPNIRSGFQVGEDRPYYHCVYRPDEKYIFICNAMRVIALIFMTFQIASLVFGLISAKKPQCVRIWRVLCIINIILCLISTNVISACITGYIFARLSNVKAISKANTAF